MLQASSLAALPGIRHGFFTREGGVSEGVHASLNGGVGSRDEPAKVQENRARMARSLGVAPGDFLTAHQVHSPDVVVADGAWASGARPRADGIVTRRPGLALGVSSADCGPILFADPEVRIIGAAHAGWRGALGGVIEATITTMETLGARRERIIAALGPTIRQPNYEVGSELTERFVAADPANARFFAPAARAGHALFDLPGYIAARLSHAGVTRIEDLGLCTYADPARFYSYRRSVHHAEPDYGRHINAIALMA